MIPEDPCIVIDGEDGFVLSRKLPSINSISSNVKLLFISLSVSRSRRIDLIRSFLKFKKRQWWLKQMITLKNHLMIKLQLAKERPTDEEKLQEEDLSAEKRLQLISINQSAFIKFINSVFTFVRPFQPRPSFIEELHGRERGSRSSFYVW